MISTIKHYIINGKLTTPYQGWLICDTTNGKLDKEFFIGRDYFDGIVKDIEDYIVVGEDYENP